MWLIKMTKNGLFSSLFFIIFILSSQTISATERTLWFLPNGSDTSKEGFIRIVNNNNIAGTVTISGISDDGGDGDSQITFTLNAKETKSLKTLELEGGSLTKGLNGSFGNGDGAWRLSIESPLDFDVYAYVRSSKGYITNVHDKVTKMGSSYTVPIFNPGSNITKISTLRISNLESTETTVQIIGTDESGQITEPISATISANSTLSITSQDLENGNSTIGLPTGLGDGIGKWQLNITADGALTVVNLLSGPDGFLINLSATPSSMDDFKIESTAYANGAVIPKIHACTDKGGSHISPQLQWTNIPTGTQSFAVIMDDEISPCGIGDNACSHWNVVNIPLVKTELSQGENLSSSILESPDGYYGPCPPSNHSYNITVYALDDTMPILNANDLGVQGLTRSQFSSQYSQYILDKTTLNGQYK